jgi:hypothetical protein
MMRGSFGVWSDRCLESLITLSDEKESFVTDSWARIVVGPFALAVAAPLVIGHYRREWMRQRLLRWMDHRHCRDVMRYRRWWRVLLAARDANARVGYRVQHGSDARVEVPYGIAL